MHGHGVGNNTQIKTCTREQATRISHQETVKYIAVTILFSSKDQNMESGLCILVVICFATWRRHRHHHSTALHHNSANLPPPMVIRKTLTWVLHIKGPFPISRLFIPISSCHESASSGPSVRFWFLAICCLQWPARVKPVKHHRGANLPHLLIFSPHAFEFCVSVADRCNFEKSEVSTRQFKGITYQQGTSMVMFSDGFAKRPRIGARDQAECSEAPHFL